ncbi:MAG: sugar nucleotide-binding protein [Symplocastrum torsivum CPER-KK1]|jgi:dTDP-4-dehydrorhamnose reductase|uniref:dTDP-4-dehydrorhamnose reductase n=1 Tax=Symplocastrum torsivum CPER-KK1 TaxID=450513 RepID=A0A951PKB9_9CYAN|nr:sugar nucleotide-binding protein [Symplocastrum torsivum CPER-KK1]
MNIEPITISPPEVWAGIECTVNRVGDQYFDQLERNGHATRLEDLDLFAELGVRAIRYPVLWERTAPNGLETADWSWADERLSRLRELGIRPIVGLVHHGSGPRHTSLIDPAFPEKLAEFARAVAQRYPWVDMYTPVNEPLTTARFSGLYGHWYPHGRDGLTFAHALLTECHATVLSMQAIREVNPAAQLVQTEDLGKTHSTPLLAYQAEFENERRWLSFDLLCGRLNRSSPIWTRLCELGVDEAELEWFLANPCPPDVLGINHYLTSERFLDERTERYPTWSHGGNGKHNYADVEAVRVCTEGPVGPRALLKETWERYGLPLAVTEVHLGCTREEQLRWLKEIWDGAVSLRHEGVDVRAVTAWSLLGAYDWNSLVTRADGFYEPGVFDLRSPQPRPTAIARMISDLAAGREPDHPLLDTPGWWQRPERLFYPSVSCRSNNKGKEQTLDFGKTEIKNPKSQRLLAIIGARGTLGKAFARLCELRGIGYRLLTRQEMDITDPTSVDAALTELNPWAVVNAAGYVRVDDAEREVDACLRANAEGPAILAASCARQGIPLLTFSSDLVFDGTCATPYIETDAVAPLNVYGRSKAEAEVRVLQAHPLALVIRTSAFFGPWDDYNFVTIALRQLAAGQTFVAAEDSVVSPTYVPDLVHTTLDLLIDGESGLWHIANKGAIAWAELARLAASTAGVDASLVEARPTRELGLTAPRPTYSVLGSERGVLLPSLDNAMSRYFDERQRV